jgi:putative tricarboxylic transport membrane protein
MTLGEQQQPSRGTLWHALARRDVLSGLMFAGVALFGLWLSRDYPIGTALRMGTGYVPRLLCWILLGLGVIVLVQGLREAQDPRALSSRDLSAWRPIVFVAASLVIFGLSIERLGLVISILLLIGVGAVAARTLKPVETLVAALVLIALSWSIFILGLGLTIPVWPEW